MNFCDMVTADRGTFLNLDEFAERHRVEGVQVTAIIDDCVLEASKTGAKRGIAAASIMLYAKTEDLPEARNAGESLNVDGTEYTVESWEADGMGMTAIALIHQQTA